VHGVLFLVGWLGAELFDPVLTKPRLATKTVALCALELINKPDSKWNQIKPPKTLRLPVVVTFGEAQQLLL
jgi:hypothetical protein